MLLALLSFTRLATPHILTILFFAWYLVVNGLVGALVPSSYKWGFFVFGLFGLFFIWCVAVWLPTICNAYPTSYTRYQMLIHVPLQRAAFTTSGTKTGFILGAGYISFIWMLYPICWGLSEGSNTITPTSEMVFYGILDILSAPVFLLFFMVYLTGFTEQDLRTTAFGSTDRGEYVETAQKGPPQPAAAPPAAAPPA